MIPPPIPQNSICPVCKGGREDLPFPGDAPEVHIRPCGWTRDNMCEWVHLNCHVAEVMSKIPEIQRKMT